MRRLTLLEKATAVISGVILSSCVRDDVVALLVGVMATLGIVVAIFWIKNDPWV